MTTFFCWTAAELAISIVSICLPNMTQLFRRAHQHGISALFTRREYAIGPENVSKKRSVGSALVHGGNGGFQGIVGIDDTTFAFNEDPLSKLEDQSGLYSESASAQQPEVGDVVAVGQVHLREDINMREYERWPTV